MIRKLAIAVAAIAALGTASVSVSTPAAAWSKGGKIHHVHGGHFHGGLRIYAGPAYVYDSCYRTYWGVNAFGEPVRRRVYVCD